MFGRNICLFGHPTYLNRSKQKSNAEEKFLRKTEFKEVTERMATLAANATPEAKKARNDEACSTAETFVHLYYERVDSKRHLIGKHTLCTGVKLTTLR